LSSPSEDLREHRRASLPKRSAAADGLHVMSGSELGRLRLLAALSGAGARFSVGYHLRSVDPKASGCSGTGWTRYLRADPMSDHERIIRELAEENVVAAAEGGVAGIRQLTISRTCLRRLHVGRRCSRRVGLEGHSLGAVRVAEGPAHLVDAPHPSVLGDLADQDPVNNHPSALAVVGNEQQRAANRSPLTRRSSIRISTAAYPWQDGDHATAGDVKRSQTLTAQHDSIAASAANGMSRTLHQSATLSRNVADGIVVSAGHSSAPEHAGTTYRRQMTSGRTPS
jgi:hypothetical protein